MRRTSLSRLTSLCIVLTAFSILTSCAQGEAGDTLPVSSAKPLSPRPALELFMASSGGIDGTPVAEIMYRNLDNVDKQSGGELVIYYYPAASLGNDVELMEAVQLNSLSIMFGAPTAQCVLIPELALLDIPCLFDTTEACNDMLSGEFMDMIQEKYNEKGLQLLTCFTTGYRYLSSNMPIYSVDDLKDLQIRTMENKYHVTYWQALNAKPTPLPFNELYVSLQRGVLAAQENPLHTFLGAGLGNVQTTLIKTRHLPFVHTYVMNKSLYESLSEENRELLHKCFDGIRDESIRAMYINENRMESVCRDEFGMEIILPSEEMLEKMKASNAGVIELMKEDLDSALVEEYVQKARKSNQKYTPSPTQSGSPDDV